MGLKRDRVNFTKLRGIKSILEICFNSDKNYDENVSSLCLKLFSRI